MGRRKGCWIGEILARYAETVSKSRDILSRALGICFLLFSVRSVKIIKPRYTKTSMTSYLRHGVPSKEKKQMLIFVVFLLKGTFIPYLKFWTFFFKNCGGDKDVYFLTTNKLKHIRSIQWDIIKFFNNIRFYIEFV